MEAPLIQAYIDKRGTLDAIRFRPGTRSKLLRPHEILVEVRFCSLNFRDVMNVLGMVQSMGVGGDVAGRVMDKGSAVDLFEVGDTVFGVPSESGMASYVVAGQ